MMKKRMFSLLLALLLTLSAWPTAVFSVSAVDASAATGETATSDKNEETTDKYASLYVQDNLLFRWDAFDSVADSASATTVTLSDRDGRGKTLTLQNATARNGYIASTSNLDFTSLVPKNGEDYADLSFDASIIQLGDATTWPVLALGTLDLSGGTGGSTAPNESHGNFFGTYKKYIVNTTTTVSYYFDDDGNLLSSEPTTGTYKEVKVPYLSMATKQYGTDHATWVRFYGNYKNQSYAIGGTLDYTVTDGYGHFDLTLYRDMKALSPYKGINYARGAASVSGATYTQITPAASSEKTAYEIALEMAAKPAAANGTYGGTASGGAFAIGGGTGKSGAIGNVGYYAFRLYSDILTADEYLQNHFADLCAFHKIDNVELFLSLSDSSKKALYTEFAKADTTKGDVEIYNTSYEDVTKDALDLAILDAYAAEQGLFDRTYVTFEGYQLSLYTSVGIRARYSLSKQALSELPEGVTLAEVGVLSADAEDFTLDALTVSQGTDGTFSAPEGVTLQCVQKNGINQSGVLEDGADALVFADTRLYDAEMPDEEVFSEYLYRAYAVFMSGQSPIVIYTDATGETDAFQNGISLYEASAALAGKDGDYVNDRGVRKVLLTVMNNLNQLQGTFDESYAKLQSLRDGMIGDGTTFATRTAEVEQLLASVKAARNNALNETDASVRAQYLQTAKNAISTLETYTADMLSLKKNGAREAADDMLAILATMQNEYENLRSFSTAMNLENADTLFADMQAKIEESEALCRELLPTVKAAYDHFAAVKNVLSDFKKEIEGTQGNGNGTTQVFLFAASTTTDNYPATTNFPWQGFGYEFDEYFDDTVSVVNPSIGGWGLKSLVGSYKQNKTNLDELFAPENSPWAKMLMRLNPGDYVFFGSTGANEEWQTGGDVYYVENPDGTYSIADKDTPGAKFYSVKQEPEDYGKMLIECGKQLIDMGVTPVFCTSFGNLGLSSSNANANSTARFTSGTKAHENVKKDVVIELNEYYQTKNGDQRTYAYLSDASERCLEVFLADMQSGMTFDEVLDTYNRTQGAIEAFYEKYGYVGSNLTKYLTTDEKYKADRVHQNIHGALLISSQTLKDLQGSGLPLLAHVVTYELDEVELICNTLTEAGVTFTDPRK